MSIGPSDMKRFAIFLVLFPTLLLTAAETKPAGGWQETGELAYSYAYARSVLGHRMRSAGWVHRNPGQC